MNPFSDEYLYVENALWVMGKLGVVDMMEWMTIEGVCMEDYVEEVRKKRNEQVR